MQISAFLNANNIQKMLEFGPRHFSWIGFDSIDNCNLHCIYCHNPRTKNLINLELLDQFLRTKILTIQDFQIGCQMEPTLDKRLNEIIKVIADSPSKPCRQFKIHTNGTLLNRLDTTAIRDAGLTHLSVSIDTAHEKTFSTLRGGAKLSRVFRNLTDFHKDCPEVIMQFVATVTTANINEIDDLIEIGMKIGAKRFHFREMFFDNRSNIVDHEKMEKLLLPPGQFQDMQHKIERQYQSRVGLYFVNSPSARSYGLEAKKNSETISS